MVVPAVAFFAQPSGSSPSPLLEPTTLKELVEFDDPPFRNATLTDLPQELVNAELSDMLLDAEFGESYNQIMSELTRKGYTFELPEIAAHMSYTDTNVEGELYSGRLLSYWSMEGPNGTRSAIIGALMTDALGIENSSMVFGVTTNLLSPEHYPEIDPYIIVNAMPYIYIEFIWYWYYPWPRLIHWKYWWYNSHSHPNWFWGPYWWWRTYLRRYHDVWYPWYWYYWHWLYWRHWYWWSAYFPWI